MQLIDKDLLSVAEARVLSENVAQRVANLASYSQPELDKAVAAMFKLLVDEGPTLIEQSVAASNIGNVQDETKLLEAFLPVWQQSLQDQVVVGPLQSSDPVHSVGVPIGAVAVVMGIEAPVLNTFFAAITAIKAGNPLVLVPHPTQSECVSTIATKLDRCVEQAGLESGTIASMKVVAPEGINALMQDPGIALVVDLGDTAVMQRQAPAAKPVYFCGTGASPVFIERSADITKAVAQIIHSRSFDNGLLPAAEQFVITESVVANKVRHELRQQGAYFMSEEDEAKLAQLLQTLSEDSQLLSGQPVQTVANRAGFEVPAKTKLLVSTQDYINNDSPYTAALAFPIIVFYLEPDWLRACAKCFALLQNTQHGHTLAIHSNNQNVIREFIVKKPVARVIVNNPCGTAALGLGSDLTPTLWLGGLTAGGGSIAHGITPSDLTYIREVGYPTAAAAPLTPPVPSAAEEPTAAVQEQFLKLLSQLINESD